jgi:hypothetical protein
LLRTVVENCPTKFFLANPGMDLERARSLFHLNQTEAACVTALIPRQQALLKRPDLAKVINLRVDPASQWMYANAPPPKGGPHAIPDPTKTTSRARASRRPVGDIR